MSACQAVHKPFDIERMELVDLLADLLVLTGNEKELLQTLQSIYQNVLLHITPDNPNYTRFTGYKEKFKDILFNLMQ